MNKQKCKHVHDILFILWNVLGLNTNLAKKMIYMEYNRISSTVFFFNTIDNVSIYMLIIQQYDEFSSIAMKFIEICCIYHTKITNTSTFWHVFNHAVNSGSTLTASPMTAGSIFPLYNFLSQEVLGIKKLAWTAGFSFPSHPFPSLCFPSLPTLPSTPPSPLPSPHTFFS